MYTVFGVFLAAANCRPNSVFLCIPPRSGRNYLPAGASYSYGAMAARAQELAAIYRGAGLGLGHRVLVALDSRPEFYAHWFALNLLGCSIVPINPAWRAPELAYVLNHCSPDLVLALQERMPILKAAQTLAGQAIPMVDETLEGLGPVTRASQSGYPDANTEAAVLYTSGTTARPKGCLLSNEYMVVAGGWYGARGGSATLHYGQERLYSPLPLFHMAGLALTTMAMILTGGCLILPERFSARHFWTDVVETDASIIHYLGVTVAALLERPVEDLETAHRVRFALGVGASVNLRRRAQQRYGIALVEGWGMTETGRSCFNTMEPRHLELNVIGRSEPGLEMISLDEQGHPCAAGEPGELCVRHSEATPREGFFSGYLNDPEATEAAWAGGWLHTGDIVTRTEDGAFIFVDRKKNIIRRAGENVAAAEVESVLSQHPDVIAVAIGAIEDPVRGEEVAACIVLTAGAPSAPKTARKIFKWAQQQLAYYKLPAWIVFAESLPLTATNKVQKSQLFGATRDEALWEQVIDLREQKNLATKA